MRHLDQDHLTAACQAAIERGDVNAALIYGAQLDAMCAAPEPATMVGAALWYANAGLRVFRLQPGDKKPYRGSRGCTEATNDPGQIQTWWTATADANIGIATGHLVDVIDIDGERGVYSWSQAKVMPDFLGTVSTPRPGGSHLYVTADPDRGNRAAWAPGVDIRGRGGYVVAPPSIGPGGVRYRWRRPLDIAAFAQQVAA